MRPLRISLLSMQDMDAIHDQTLHIFETIGIRIQDPYTLTLCRQNGASVDWDTEIVKIPRELVQRLLSTAPSRATMGGLNGKILDVGGTKSYYTSLVLDPFIVDFDHGVRKPILADVKRNTILGESLSRVSCMMRMQYPVSDIEGEDSYYRTMETFLGNTTKHIAVYPDSVENCRDWIEVAQKIAEVAAYDQKSAPLLSIAMAVISPLFINSYNIAIMRLAIESGYPILSTVCPMAGATSPFNVMGTFVQANCEALAPVLIAQLFKNGHPVLYGMGPSITDMRTGTDLYYRLEKMLFKVMANQMGQYYHLPTSGEAGGSLTHLYDMQNGAESMSYLLASLTGGQNIIGGLGSLGNANGMSSEQIVMQSALVDMAEYLSRGISMEELVTGTAAITRVGPGGNFLMDDLTLTMLRNQKTFFHSPFVDLSGESSAPGFTRSMLTIAHDAVRQIAADYICSVPGDVRETIKKHFFAKYKDKKISRLD